jgi:hypothetical protein
MTLQSDYFVAGQVATGSVAAVTGSAAQLLEANQARKSFYLFNDSTVPAYVKFGLSASFVDYSFQVPSLAFYESHTPCPLVKITAVWTAVTGSMKTTEVT